jgi:aryl carrier-like protein
LAVELLQIAGYALKLRNAAKNTTSHFGFPALVFAPTMAQWSLLLARN